ncbi:hypothetical protein N7523_000865 [Penicillium sp. IBT 18751x]|nr:hypothetical protein N7523_000865 [Penicillium sp. IBT 18751x]
MSDAPRGRGREEMQTFPFGPLTVAVVEATLIIIADVVVTEEMTPAVVVISAVAGTEATSAAAVIEVVVLEAMGIEVEVTEGVAEIVDGGLQPENLQFTYSEGQPVPVPDATVQKLEDSLADKLVVARQKTPSGPKYPTRPGYGTIGKPVTLYANYFALTSVGKLLFRYHVEIKNGPGKADKAPVGRKARQVVRLLLEEYFASNKKKIATDYRSTLIACVELLKEEKTFDVRYKDEGQDDYPESPRVYKITCQPTGRISPSALMDYLTSSNTDDLLDSKPEIVAALNIIMGHHPKTHEGIVSVGANKHFSLEQGGIEKADLGNGLEVLRGFFISVRAATARVLLNVQVKYMACFKEGPLSMVIADWQPEARFRNPYRLEVFLKRMRVKTTHIERKSKSGKPRPAPLKTISGLAAKYDGKDLANPPKVKHHGAGPRDVLFFLSNPDTPGGGPLPGPSGAEPAYIQGKSKKGKKAPPKVGPAQAGKYISVEQFFRDTYNITVDPNWPVINTGSRQNPTYMPVEVLEVPAGQAVGSKLSPNQTSAMLKFAVMGRKPAENALSIVTKGVSMLGIGEQQNETLATFGINAIPKLITVQGRVLAAPQVMYGGQKAIQAMFGGWNMKSIKFAKPATLQKWSWLYFDRPNSQLYGIRDEELKAGLTNLTKSLQEMGVAANPPFPGKRVQLNGSNDFEVIGRAVRELQALHQPQLILGILPAKDTSLYNCIKQVCDLHCGVRNVNVQADKFRGDQRKGIVGADPQYCANVGLKVNLKMGGGNQSLRSPDLGVFGDGKTMLVGLDVTHPSPGSAGSAPSVAAIVASIDSNLAQWPAEIRIQTARQEMVDDLENLLKSRIIRWRVANKNKLPENIVVYRDGVSESQYDTVVNTELPLLRKACTNTYPPSDTKKGLPRIAIVIVGKRHNTRFYATNEGDAERSFNPQPGTVVDRGISEARNWDFYLQAHSALQGTARPAHYFTVWDEIFNASNPGKPAKANALNAADVLQKLTHNLCYLFGRATKAVSVCPPAYYADLVCTRARCYLSDQFDPSPAASMTGTESGEQEVNRGSVVLHPDIADSMFYI